MLSIPATLEAKNLTILSSTQLNNYELLDVYLHDDIAFIPGGLGGLNIVDVSDPTNPIVLSSYHASGCDWGRIYTWAVSGNYAYGAGRECGVHVVDITNLAEPAFSSQYNDPNHSDQRYEHAEIYGSTLFLSKHQGGVELVDISQPQSLSQLSIIASVNAWASLAVDSLLYIADGAGGLKIYSISNPTEPYLLGRRQTSGTAKDLSLTGSKLFVAVGAAGVDMLDVSNPRSPVLIDNYNTSGYASRVSSNDDRVVVSDWDDVEVLSYNENSLSLVGYKDTGGRVMAIGMTGNIVYSAEWRQLTILEYGMVSEADIDLSSRKIEFPRVHPRNSHTTNLTLKNNGQTTLEITDASISSAAFELVLPEDNLAPDSIMNLTVIYRPANGHWNGQIVLNTSDWDEPNIEIDVTGNYPNGPMVGDMAPSFELEVVNGLGTLNSDDLLGQPAVLAFFTSW